MSFLDRILNRAPQKVGRIVYGENQKAASTAYDYPVTSGRVQGVIVPRGDQTYFQAYNGGSYVTFDDYGQWAGMVCEASVEPVDSLLDESLKGYAYEIFVHNNGNGKLYKLPSPEHMESFPRDKGCFCPFCIVDYFDGCIT